jgi:hypothetical protein
MSDQFKYGNILWSIHTDLSGDGEIRVVGDRAEINSAGCLILWRNEHPGPDGTTRPAEPTFILAPGHWKACYFVSLLTGEPSTVVSWEPAVP